MKKQSETSIFLTTLLFVLFFVFPASLKAQNNDNVSDSTSTDSSEVKSDTSSYNPMGFLNLNSDNNLYAILNSESTDWDNDTTKTDTTKSDSSSNSPVGFLNNTNNNLYAVINYNVNSYSDTTETDTTKSDSSSYAPIGYNSNSIDVNQLYAVLDNLSGADSTDTTTTDSSESDTTSMGYQGSSQNTSFTELNFNLKPGQTAAFEHLAIGIRNIKKNFYKKIIALS